MRLRTWPAAAKIVQQELSIEADSRGLSHPGGQLVYERGLGARWRGRVSVAAMSLANAFAFRAFLHSLRGASGSFLFPLGSWQQATSTNPLTSAGDLTEYTDDYRFSDGYAYADTYGPTYAPLSAAAAEGADTLTVQLVAGVTLAAGGVVYVGDPATVGQLFRITAVSVGASDWTLTVRPRVRDAFLAGAEVAFADIVAPFRVAEDVPAVPIIAGARSLPVQLDIEEAY